MAARACWKGSYEEALKTLVKRKAAGKPVKPAEREEKPDNVISLMDALRQSLKGKASAKQSAHSPARRATKRPVKKKRTARRRGRGRRANHRHARACPGHPRLNSVAIRKTWMTGTSPAMTRNL
jgi:hypothetical protein